MSAQDLGSTPQNTDQSLHVRERSVVALIPAYNEEERISATIASLRYRHAVDIVAVIDDGSTDKTAANAREAGANLVITQKNQGKGAALNAGYRQLRDKADIFLLLDADLGTTASEAVKLLAPLSRDEADMVVALFPPDPDFEASGQSGGGGFVVRLANSGIKKAAGVTFLQPLCGQRAVRRSVLEALENDNTNGPFAEGFGVEVALTIGALRAGFRVVETPTQFRHKVTGSNWSGILHRARQYFDVRRTVTRCLRK